MCCKEGVEAIGQGLSRSKGDTMLSTLMRVFKECSGHFSNSARRVSERERQLALRNTGGKAMQCKSLELIAPVLQYSDVA